MTCQVFTELKGLSDDWDNIKSLRDRVQQHRRLILEPPVDEGPATVPEGAVPKTVKCAKLNSDVLVPVLHKMSSARDCVPCIETLIFELDAFYKARDLTVYYPSLKDDAWSIRYLFGVIKSYLWKRAPPREPCLRCGLGALGISVVFRPWDHALVQDALIRSLLTTFGANLEEWKTIPKDGSGLWDRELKNWIDMMHQSPAFLQPFVFFAVSIPFV